MFKLLFALFACVVALATAQFGPPNNFGGGGFVPGRPPLGRPGGFGRPPANGGFGAGNRRPGGGGNFGGAQDNCPSVCPAIYMPTCGFNGNCYKSFGNSCELGAAACNGRGNFRQVPESDCNRRGVRICA